ncbi:Ppx/GppA phosphatase family protein [Campylobacter geochelonis]|uniref:Ppx/GppA phosphatase family protein n=1 Tax=Campylobacter geochelonis TaxID=1780362 RepID=UPI000770A3BD|nr:Ppx/GppA phosphatase family protein [Campylobacter geochelonis]CZE46779.1 phosphatase [Campylobacter geochelonis]
MSRRVAVIDLGSNSARMAIFERTSRLGFYILGEYKMKVRLGEGAYENEGVLQADAMQKCLAAFIEFKKLITRYKVNKVLAVGTSALRDAPNSKTFINMVKKLGINLKVIDGDMEAYYGGFAASNLLFNLKEATTIDIGGGSTELAHIVNGKVVETLSLNVGTVRLKELFFDKKELKGLEAFIQETLNLVPKSFKCDNIIAIGGSLRAISSAIMQIKNYPLNIVHGFSYKYADFSDLIERISVAKTLELNQFPIKKDRYDTIRGGAYIFKKVVEFLGAKSVQTSGVGVREGVFLTNLIGKNAKFPANFNPSLKSVQDRFIVDARPNIAKFAKGIFEVLSELHGIDESYKKDLITASKLLNIGLKIGFYSKHTHANYIILSTLNYGYTHKQKALIATIIKLHGKKSLEGEEFLKLNELLPPAKSVIWLGFMLELARVLDEADTTNISFEFSNSTLQIYGLKDAIFVKDSVKKMLKPAIFAITFN